LNIKIILASGQETLVIESDVNKFPFYLLILTQGTRLFYQHSH
jgi:hypothetical protein